MLAQPANRHLITKIKASITAGIRPTSMILHEQPTAPWVAFDFILLEAYQMLQDELCPNCGHPVWLCRSDSPNVYFKAEVGYCAGTRAVKEAEDKARPTKDRADKATRASWGKFTYAVPATLPGADFPTREDYYADLAKRNGAVE